MSIVKFIRATRKTKKPTKADPWLLNRVCGSWMCAIAYQEYENAMCWINGRYGLFAIEIVKSEERAHFYYHITINNTVLPFFMVLSLPLVESMIISNTQWFKCTRTWISSNTIFDLSLLWWCVSPLVILSLAQLPRLCWSNFRAPVKLP